MTQHPDYGKIQPDSQKHRSEYSYAERRAEVNELIEGAGHHRAIEQSQRDLADRYDVSQTTVWKDIQAVLEWRADNLGAGAEAELDVLKTRAVLDLLDEGKPAEAYHLMRKHYETLMEMGVKERAPEKQEIDHGGEPGWFERVERAAASLDRDGDRDHDHDHARNRERADGAHDREREHVGNGSGEF